MSAEPVSEIVDFLNAQYAAQENDHYETAHGCMHCGDDWPCYPIRDIESKRRILDLHPHATQRERVGESLLRANYGPNWETRLKHLDEPYCETCHVEDGMIEGDGGRPCETLRLLAAPFSGEPGYDKRWAV